MSKAKQKYQLPEYNELSDLIRQAGINQPRKMIKAQGNINRRKFPYQLSCMYYSVINYRLRSGTTGSGTTGKRIELREIGITDLTRVNACLLFESINRKVACKLLIQFESIRLKLESALNAHIIVKIAFRNNDNTGLIACEKIIKENENG